MWMRPISAWPPPAPTTWSASTRCSDGNDQPGRRSGRPHERQPDLIRCGVQRGGDRLRRRRHRLFGLDGRRHADRQRDRRRPGLHRLGHRHDQQRSGRQRASSRGQQRIWSAISTRPPPAPTTRSTFVRDEPTCPSPRPTASPRRCRARSTTYTIVVSNDGPSAVTGASVSDPLPAGVTAATWTVAGSSGGGTVTGAGQRHRCPGHHRRPARRRHRHLHLHGPGQPLRHRLADQHGHGQPARRGDRPRPGRQQRHRHRHADAPGRPVHHQDRRRHRRRCRARRTTYTIVVSNDGPSAVTGASVSDPLPAGVTAATWAVAGQQRRRQRHRAGQRHRRPGHHRQPAGRRHRHLHRHGPGQTRRPPAR